MENAFKAIVLIIINLIQENSCFSKYVNYDHMVINNSFLF